jgi:DNA polymerase
MLNKLSLNQVNQAIKKKFSGRKLVFGKGQVGSRVVFVCEIPGEEEHKNNKPIAGHPEKLLSQMLKSAGIDKKKVYFTNVIKYSASIDKAITPKELKANGPFLKEEIKTVGPKIVVTLGNTALNGLGVRLPLDNIHGRTLNFGSYELLPTFHPEHALKDSTVKTLLQNDINKLRDLINQEKTTPQDI